MLLMTPPIQDHVLGFKPTDIVYSRRVACYDTLYIDVVFLPIKLISVDSAAYLGSPINPIRLTQVAPLRYPTPSGLTS